MDESQSIMLSGKEAETKGYILYNSIYCYPGEGKTAGKRITLVSTGNGDWRRGVTAKRKHFGAIEMFYILMVAT